MVLCICVIMSSFCQATKLENVYGIAKNKIEPFYLLVGSQKYSQAINFAYKYIMALSVCVYMYYI